MEYWAWWIDGRGLRCPSREGLVHCGFTLQSCSPAYVLKLEEEQKVVYFGLLRYHGELLAWNQGLYLFCSLCFQYCPGGGGMLRSGALCVVDSK